MRQPGQLRDRVGADLAEERCEIVVEALARHQAVAKGQDDDERLDDLATARYEPEEGADMPAMPGRFGDVELVRSDVGALARPAPYLDIERAPPLPVVRGGAVVALPALTGCEVLEPALGMECRKGAGQVVCVLRLEVAADESGEFRSNGRQPVL